MDRGSRKHVLDWTDSPAFLDELRGLLPEVPLEIDGEVYWMPRGHASPDEGRLETFGPSWLPAHPAWRTLEDWWLIHKGGANTPNWDIAVGCTIENRPGLVLVEAKAHLRELSAAGKSLGGGASPNSRQNHEHIGGAIDEACAGWRRIDPRVKISRDTHYQLANRLAFTWKLASLGISVVLLYLGFTGDEGIRNVGDPFADDADWQRAFGNYVENSFPVDLVGGRFEFAESPAWVLSRSREVLSHSPPPGQHNSRPESVEAKVGVIEKDFELIADVSDNS